MTFPFRFYGCEPSEWHEGANFGHAYELTFAERPSGDAIRRLAELAETLRETPARMDGRAWEWHGRSARFCLGEANVSHEAYFAAAEQLMRDIHAIAPLEQVLFSGAWWESGLPAWGKSAWDAASVREQAQPTEAFAGVTPMRWPEFERARRVARLGEDAVLAEERAVEEARAGGELVSVPCDPPPPLPEIPEAIRAAAKPMTSAPYELQVTFSGRIHVRGTRVPGRLAWVDDGEIVTLFENEHLGIFGAPKVSPNGRWFLVDSGHPNEGARPDTRFLVDSATQTIIEVELTLEGEPHVCAMAWLDDTRFAIATKAEVRVYRLEDGEPPSLLFKTARSEGCQSMVAVRGRILALFSRYDVWLYRIGEHALECFAQKPQAPSRSSNGQWFVRDERVFAVGADVAWLELQNIEAEWLRHYPGDPL